MGQSSKRLLAGTAPAIAAATLAGLAATAVPVYFGPAMQTAIQGALVAAGVALLWRLTMRSTAGAVRPIALTLVALATVLPEYVVDVHFAWGAAGPTGPWHAPPVLAAVTGSSRIMAGLAWPLVIFLYWARSGGDRLRLREGQSAALWFLLLAALYAFTIYLKGYLSVLDSLLLLLLFAAYLWTIWRRQPGGRLANRAGPGTTTAAPARSRVVATGALALLVVATTAAAAAFADAVTAGAESIGADPFTAAQALVPLASKLPLMVARAVLVWKARTDQATSVLLGSQVIQLTLLLGTVPLAYLLHGHILGGADSLGESVGVPPRIDALLDRYQGSGAVHRPGVEKLQTQPPREQMSHG